METLGLQGAYLLLGGNRHVRIKLASDVTEHMVMQEPEQGGGRWWALEGMRLFSLKAASSLGFSSQQQSPCSPLAPVLSSNCAELYS